MNYQRILRITNGYLFLTGYQIRWWDQKSHHYRLTICGVLYFLILFAIYLICFGHHFEQSAMLKMMLDISPFLNKLVRLQVLLGLKVFLLCMIEWRTLTKISNALMDIFRGSFERENSLDRYEIMAYVMVFSTLLVAFTFGLYIAVEYEFTLPPLDYIMIAMALLVPHLMLAGCLRLYSLGLWLIKQELFYLQNTFKEEIVEQPKNVIEIINPVFNNNVELCGIHKETLKRLEYIAEHFKNFDSGLQKQLALLFALNFNSLLYGIYSQLYFENTWNVIFTGRNRRVFYAANSAIFVCILLDYIILLFSQHKFRKTKQNFIDLVFLKLYANKRPLEDMRKILKDVKRVLTKNFNLNIFGFVEFNTWNFLMVQGLMLSIISIIVTYQYFNDQILALTLSMNNDESDSD